MRRIAFEYGTTLLVMLALDAVWLSVTVPTIYRPRMQNILLPDPIIWVAVLFYLVYAAGVVFFAVMPSRAATLGTALLQGALFGFVAYATYDLTNQATIKDWSPLITVLDMIWGAVITGSAATAATWVGQRWGEG